MSPLNKSDHVIVEANLNIEIPRKQSTFTKYYSIMKNSHLRMADPAAA